MPTPCPVSPFAQAAVAPLVCGKSVASTSSGPSRRTVVGRPDRRVDDDVRDAAREAEPAECRGLDRPADRVDEREVDDLLRMHGGERGTGAGAVDDHVDPRVGVRPVASGSSGRSGRASDRRSGRRSASPAWSAPRPSPSAPRSSPSAPRPERRPGRLRSAAGEPWASAPPASPGRSSSSRASSWRASASRAAGLITTRCGAGFFLPFFGLGAFGFVFGLAALAGCGAAVLECPAVRAIAAEGSTSIRATRRQRSGCTDSRCREEVRMSTFWPDFPCNTSP